MSFFFIFFPLIVQSFCTCVAGQFSTQEVTPLSHGLFQFSCLLLRVYSILSQSRSFSVAPLFIPLFNIFVSNLACIWLTTSSATIRDDTNSNISSTNRQTFSRLIILQILSNHVTPLCTGISTLFETCLVSLHYIVYSCSVAI